MSEKTVKEILEGVVKLGASVSFLNSRCELDKATYEDLKSLVKASMKILNSAVEAPRVLAEVKTMTPKEFFEDRRKRAGLGPKELEASRAKGGEFGGIADLIGPSLDFSLTSSKASEEAMWNGYRRSDVLAAVQVQMAGWHESSEPYQRVYFNDRGRLMAQNPGGAPHDIGFWEPSLRMKQGLRRPDEPDYRKFD